MTKSKLKPLTTSKTVNNVISQLKVETEPEATASEPEVKEVPEQTPKPKQKPGNRIGLNIVIPVEHNKALDLIALSKNITKAQLIRDIIADVVDQNQDLVNEYQKFVKKIQKS